MNTWPKDEWGCTVEPEAVVTDEDAARVLMRHRDVRKLMLRGGPATMCTEEEYRRLFPNDSEEEMRDFLDSQSEDDNERSFERGVRYVFALDRAITALGFGEML